MTCWRYIDGIFFAWENGQVTLKKTIEKLNTSHPIIKFKENKNFLNAHIGSADGEPMADLFVKPTDTYQYLDLNSSHAY